MVALLGIALALALTLPLAWKWELGVRRVAVGVTALGVLWALLVALLEVNGWASVLAVAAGTVVSATGVLAYRFYRDPERRTPTEDDVLVSPADGEVIYVRRSEEGRVPVATKHGRDYDLEELTKTPLEARDAIVIGIAMSFLDVHVNRAPIAGTVTLCRHFPGLFGSLGKPEMVLANERATTLISRGSLQIAVVQIASRLVRQIVGYVREGEDVVAGQRIGVIRLGSQVDVVVPVEAAVDVLVSPGDRVWAGESVLARLDV